MKVALVQESVERGRGGAETSTLEMAEALAAEGVEVELLYAAGPASAKEHGQAEYRLPVPPNVPPDRSPNASPDGSPHGSRGRPQRAAGSVAGLTLIGLPVAGDTKLQRMKSYFAAVTAYRATTRFDVVHAVVPYPHADVYQPRGGTYPETIRRTLVIVRNPVWRWLKAIGRRFNARQQYLLKCERELLNRANPPRVACVSEYVRRQITADYPRAAAGAVVVFNGVAPPRVDARAGAELRAKIGVGTSGSTGVAPVLLFVAHNFRLKGLRELLEALPRVRDSSPHLIVAGRDRDGPYRAQVARHGIADRVHFVGPRPSGALLAAADVLAHPTWYDPCSRVVLEALAVRMPVVTTRCNGAAEVLSEGETGWTVATPEDVDSLAAALSRALHAAAARSPVDGAGAMPAFEWTMSRHARALLRLYQSLELRGE